jgi:RecB family exonuclease
VGIRAALGVAIDRARVAGVLRLTARVASSHGFRRRLLGRINAWTRMERNPAGAPPDRANDAVVEEWEIFRHYREAIKSIGVEDSDGLAVWASQAMRRHRATASLGKAAVLVLEPPLESPAVIRALDTLAERAESMCVTLPWDVARTEPFATVAPLRQRLRKGGFEEVELNRNADRPRGLAGIQRELFRDHGHATATLEVPAGVHVLGAPQGEGVGLAVARHVNHLLTGGASPGEILVLAREWDDQAQIVLETLRAWSIPAFTDVDLRLTHSQTISTLRLALSLPIDDWDAERLIRILRNGQVRPEWPDVREPLDLVTMAASIREARVFRGCTAIRAALTRASGTVESRSSRDHERQQHKAASAARSVAIFNHLVDLYNGVETPAAWATQFQRVRRIQSELRLGSTARVDLQERAVLDAFYDALEGHGDVLESLGLATQTWTWPEFVRIVDSLIHDATSAPPTAPSGSVRLTTVDEAVGISAPHIILLNLTEGSFPARAAIEDDPATTQAGPSDSTAAPSRGYAREMLQFLRVTGSADQSLTFVFPSTDEKGQTLLTAGFLDDVRRLFSEEAWGSCAEIIQRLPPILDEDWARAPNDARVRAVAVASMGHDRQSATLRALAASRLHRPVLDRVAAALHVAERRTSRRKRFGRYEGLLRDPRIARQIATDFAADRPAFSPSQLESYAFCPFQFFMKSVLRLETTDDRHEFEEDFTARGSLLHDALETLHKSLKDVPDEAQATLADRVAADIGPIIRGLLDQMPAYDSDVEAGLREIDARLLERFGRRYAEQFAAYQQRAGSAAKAHTFEVGFGKSGLEVPPLILGKGDRRVQIQGRIDRIDIVRTDDGWRFRIIDYKTGSTPSPADLRTGLALQLPLYAWAVEELELGGEAKLLADFGYWALRKEGYRAAKLPKAATDDNSDAWTAYRRRVETYVLALVASLRRAAFPVSPKVTDCTRYCDYRFVCRIAQVRNAGKEWREAPRMESAP